MHNIYVHECSLGCLQGYGWYALAVIKVSLLSAIVIVRHVNCVKNSAFHLLMPSSVSLAYSTNHEYTANKVLELLEILFKVSN